MKYQGNIWNISTLSKNHWRWDECPGSFWIPILYSRYFFDHPDISGFWSNKILDQGPLDGNPAINVYSRVVWVLAGFWIFFYSVVRPLEVPFFRLKQVFCTFWSQCSRFWYNKNVFATDNIMHFMCLLKEIMAVSSYLVYFLYW